MSQYLLPVLFALFVWWFSTGAILYLDGLPRRTFQWSMAGATGLALAGLYGLYVSSSSTSVAGAYCAFSCGVLVWAWHEVSFLLGFVTGPRVTPSPPGCSALTHFVCAIQTILYHEIALAGMAVAVVLVSWNAPNQVGTWTFLILWCMRQSAKLNLFLGVRNLSENFLPDHLRYLGTYFTRRRMNLLFPISVTVSTVLAVLIWRSAFSTDSGPFERTGLTFAGTLLTLAILEHWFMVLPLPIEALWNWGLKSRVAPMRS